MNINSIAQVTIAACIAITSLVYPAFSQPVGQMKRVVNDVIARKKGATRTLKTRSAVNASESIAATQDSHGEILLDDKSKIIVGPGASIELDDFVVGDNGLKSGTLNMVKGAFRFISAKSTKKAVFDIRTPMATIGIRGTAFDVYVREKGVTDVVLFSGKVEVCTNGGACKLVTSQCDIVRVSSQNAIESLPYLRATDRKQEDKDYSLTSNQFRFPMFWRVSTLSCSARAFRDRRIPMKIDLGEDTTYCVFSPTTPTPSVSIASPPGESGC